MSVIIVTALFDINRSVHGDGRKMEDYFEWLNKTLKLNATFVVFTESKFINKIKNMKQNIIIVEQKLEEIPYYKYKKNIQNIINLPEYKKRIEYPDRIECNLELYNVILYSKFGWLKKVINTYKYDYYFWMDAGCSRFFGNVNTTNPWPNKMKFMNTKKLIIQGRHDLKYFKIDNNFIWTANNLLYGTLFGGCSDILLDIGEKVEITFQRMIKQNKMNNEQLILAMIWNKNKNKFMVIINNTKKHLPLFEFLTKN